MLERSKMVYNKFADYYDIVYQKYDYQKECGFLIAKFREFRRGKIKRVLDLGCGTGTHDIILSEKGYEVVGIDVSEAMVRQAREKASRAGVNTEFLVQDMREIDVRGKFDCALCLFGGFGYLLSEQDLSKLFRGLRSALKPSGLLMFEFWNEDGLKPSPYRSWDITEDQLTGLRVYRLSRSDYDSDQKVLTIQFKFLVLHQERVKDEFDETHSIRIYSTEEMERILEGEGFQILHQIVGYAQEDKPIADKFRVFVVGRFRGGDAKN